MSGKKIIILGALAVLTSCSGDNGTKPTTEVQKNNQTESRLKNIEQVSNLNTTNTKVSYQKRHAIELNSVINNKNILLDESLMNTFLIDVKLENTLTTNSKFSCAKINLSSRGETTEIPAGKQNATIKIKLESGENDSTVYCRLINEGKEISNQSFELQRTLILKNEVHIKDLSIKSEGGLLSLDRLILADENTTIITDGALLNLKVNEFYSGNGLIETFKDGDTQKENRNGLSGGIINIKTDSAIGTLRIQMRGENAGEQTKIPEKNLVIPSHDVATDAIADLVHSVRPKCHYGGSHSSSSEDGGCADVESYLVLDRAGRAGLQGARGNIGFIGYAGNDGGDTGIMNFESSSEDFAIEILKPIPGDGSKGAVGGEGSEGATGGTAGAYRMNNIAYGGGAPGPQGYNGTNGKDGNNGKVQLLCFENKKLGLCNK